MLAVVTLPWWLGGVARHFGSQQGVAFASYTNVGYGRWAVENVTWRNAGITLNASRIEGPHPLAYWWLKNNSSVVVVDGLFVKVDTEKQVLAEGRGAITGPYSLVGEYRRIKRMLPPLELSTGSITIDGEPTLSVSGVVLNAYNLAISKVSFAGHDATIKVQLNDQFTGHWSNVMFNDFLKLEIRGLGKKWDLKGTMGDHRNQVELEGQWLDQNFSASAVFMSDHWIPDSGRVEAKEWLVSASELSLGDYYQTISGDVLVSWVDGRFNHVELQVDGQPIAEGKYPPLSVRLLGSASLESAKIRDLNISTPGLSVIADQPFEISRESVSEGATAEVRLRADLAALPMFDGTGALRGMLNVTTRRGDWPVVEFNLKGGVGYRDYPVLSGEVSGQTSWPQWEIETLRIQDKVGSEVRVRAEGNGVERRVDTGQWEASIDADLMTQWLDMDVVELSEIQTKGTFSGAFAAIKHEGAFSAENVVLDNFNAMAITGDWQGQGGEVKGAAKAAARDGELTLTGELQESSARVELEVKHGAVSAVRSQQPFEVSWEKELRIRALDMVGPGWALESSALEQAAGRAKVSIRNVDLAWLTDWLVSPPAIPEIRELSADVTWTESGVFGTAEFDGDLPISETLSVQTQLIVKSTSDSLVVSDARFGWEGEPVARLIGQLPIRLSATVPYWEIDQTGAIDARMVLEHSPKLWREVAQRSRVRVENPAFDLALSGTWSRPAGTGQLSVERIVVEPKPGEVAWPVISMVEAQLIDDGTGLVVEPLTARFDGQLITIRGQVPFTPEEWTRLSDTPLQYFREQGRGSVSIPRAELSALSKFVPDMLVPTGTVELALAYSLEDGVNGRIDLRDAVTRPLGPLGALQALNADLRFADRSLDIKEVRALMGGQPVTVSGEAQWPREGAVQMDLTLLGKNLPLVRNTGVLLRSDLDLRIRSDESGAGEVSGTARLRDGLVLVDVRSLVPRGGGASVPARRPPYFSVAAEPLNQWNLNVHVTGERFLRLRTPIITGTASVDARLDGTLGVPRVVGEITLNEGELRLPFARLSVDEFVARLTESNPYDPEIRLEATGQRLGYDLAFELSGKASDPRLDLRSSPILSSEQVLLLVMAGVTPRQNGRSAASNRALKLGMYFSQGILGDLFGTDENDRLTVSSGEDLSRQGKETYRFDYEVADRWTVVAEYDEFDHYNAALKWRIKPNSEPDPIEVADTEEQP